MHIDSIKEGIVIDHITAGNAMRIYNLLGFDKLECSIAIIKNPIVTAMELFENINWRSLDSTIIHVAVTKIPAPRYANSTFFL